MIVLLLGVAVIAPPVFGAARAVDILVVLLLPALVRAWWRRRRTLVLTTPEVLFLLFTGWAAAATLVGLVTGTAGRGTWAALTMARLLELIAVYAAARLWTPARAVLVRAACILGAGLAAWGAWEVVNGVVIHGEPYIRAFNEGWFRGESSHVAGALVLLGIASIAVPRAAETGAANGVGLAASLAGVLVSGSRGALAAGAVTAARALALTRRRPAVIALAVVLALVALAAPASFRNRAVHVLDQGAYAGPHVDRFAAWRVAAAESPAWGLGLGARPSSVYESNYAWAFAETGLPGLCLGVCFLLSLIVRPRAATTFAATTLSARTLAHDDPSGAGIACEEEENSWRVRSGIGIALLILSFGANVFLIARIAIPAAILLGCFAPGIAVAGPESSKVTAPGSDAPSGAPSDAPSDASPGATPGPSPRGPGE